MSQQGNTSQNHSKTLTPTGQRQPDRRTVVLRGRGHGASHAAENIRTLTRGLAVLLGTTARTHTTVLRAAALLTAKEGTPQVLTGALCTPHSGLSHKRTEPDTTMYVRLRGGSHHMTRPLRRQQGRGSWVGRTCGECWWVWGSFWG